MSQLKNPHQHRTIALHILSIQPMDFFATLFTTNAPECDSAPATPIDSDYGGGGGGPGCIVA